MLADAREKWDMDIITKLAKKARDIAEVAEAWLAVAEPDVVVIKYSSHLQYLE